MPNAIADNFTVHLIANVKWFISPLDATKQKLVSLPSIVVQVVVCAQSSLCWKNLGSFMEKVRMTLYQQAKTTAVSPLKSPLEGLCFQCD